MTSLTPLSSPTTTESCCTRIQKCLFDEKTTRIAKATFWSVSALGALLIPVPFLNGLMSGSMLFMGIHEIIQYPLCDFRPIAQSRTWKHISTGAAISGIGWGLNMLSIYLDILSPSISIWAGIAGTFLACKIVYSNVIFAIPPESSQLLGEEGSQSLTTQPNDVP